MSVTARFAAFSLAAALAIGGVMADTAPAGSEDKFIWLEEVKGEKALEWVKAHNATTEGELPFSRGPGRAPHASKPMGAPVP